MELIEFVGIAKSQINWEKFRRDYWKVSDLDMLLKRVREINNPSELTLNEIHALKKTVNHSVFKVVNYDYGNLDGDTLRDEALNPLYIFMSELIKLEKEKEAKNETQVIANPTVTQSYPQDLGRDQDGGIEMVVDGGGAGRADWRP